MHGSTIEYVVQHRVQDYWLDLVNGKFSLLYEAKKHVELAEKKNPNTDFRLVKRTTSFLDELQNS